MQHVFLSGMKKKDKSCKLCLVESRILYVSQQENASLLCFSTVLKPFLVYSLLQNLCIHIPRKDYLKAPFPHMSPSIHKQIITQSFSNIPLCSNIQESTFPHQPKAGGPPFLSRTGNLRAPAPINSNSFCEIALFIFSSILISSSQNVYLLFYAIPRRIVNRQKPYRRKASKILPSLEREGKGRKLCLLSANSYGIWEDVKQNVFFLQRVRMQKLINESMRNVFLSGERGGPSQMAES